MTSTKVDNIDARGAKAKVVSTFPTVYDFYGERDGKEAETPAWVGGEMIFYTGTNKLFVQTATSGASATWKKLDDSWATTTSTSTSTTTSTTSSTTSCSTSTSTSSSSSTSTSSSSTSSSTSTSTSTTTSTTSSSTSTSSTTTS